MPLRDDAVCVDLPYTVVYCFALLGIFRRTSSWKNGLDPNKHTKVKSDWATDIDGTFGEATLARYLGVWYEPKNMDLKGSDVGRQVQTRSTTYDDGHLIFRENDEPNKNQAFVLCITTSHKKSVVPLIGTRVWLVGWLYGNECMRPEWLKTDEENGKKRWEVPQKNLKPMAEFPFPRQKSLFSA